MRMGASSAVMRLVIGAPSARRSVVGVAYAEMDCWQAVGGRLPGGFRSGFRFASARPTESGGALSGFSARQRVGRAISDPGSARGRARGAAGGAWRPAAAGSARVAVVARQRAGRGDRLAHELWNEGRPRSSASTSSGHAAAQGARRRRGDGRLLTTAGYRLACPGAAGRRVFPARAGRAAGVGAGRSRARRKVLDGAGCGAARHCRTRLLRSRRPRSGS